MCHATPKTITKTISYKKPFQNFLTDRNHLIEFRNMNLFENMFCKEKQSVAARALINPETSKDNSVIVANRTPPMMGIRDT